MKVIGIKTERRAKWTGVDEFSRGDLLIQTEDGLAHFIRTTIPTHSSGWAVCCKIGNHWKLGDVLRGDCCNYIRVIDGEPEYEGALPDGVEVRFEELNPGDTWGFTASANVVAMRIKDGVVDLSDGNRWPLGDYDNKEIVYRYNNATLVLDGVVSEVSDESK